MTTLQATGYRLQATGYRLQVLLLLILVTIMGCGSQASNASLPTVKESTPMLSELRFDGDYLIANRKHAVGIYVEAWGIVSQQDIERFETSCKCDNVRVIELEEFTHEFAPE